MNERGPTVAIVKVFDGEPIDRALKRFKRKTELYGIVREIRDRQHYNKPSVKKKLKTVAARKRKNKTRRNDKGSNPMFD